MTRLSRPTVFYLLSVCFIIDFYFHRLATVVHADVLRSRTFDLPSLTVYADRLYLVRKEQTKLSCQIAPGWSEARLEDVKWLKDGEPVEKLAARDDTEGFRLDGHTIFVDGNRQQSEGEFQCVAQVVGIRLSNQQVVSTRLVSSPLKLCRARITKFERSNEIIVRTRQGQVARLPCIGLPDVVPGPPEICFEREGHSGCHGGYNDTKQLATPSGLQISLVQPEDAGKYFCVVRNTYTNQTRTAPKPVILIVEPVSVGTELAAAPTLVPHLVHPPKPTTADRPIVVDAVVGDSILLECVFIAAKVVWRKTNGSSAHISISDQQAHLHQLWGNLRVRSVSQSDAGLYVCHGFSPFDPIDFQSPKHPRVYYELVVHAPTDVRLGLSQNAHDRSWHLSCHALNLRYEIPMVFVNGTPLIDAIDEWGVPSQTNFYANPINVTLQTKREFEGSVQCISRPAMEEAEIYGVGLERGRSSNVYVLGSMSASSNDDLIQQGPQNVTVEVGKDVELPCIVQRVKSKYWLKDGIYVRLFNQRTRIVGSNTLSLRAVEKEDEGWYTCVVTGASGEPVKAAAYLSVAPFSSLPSTTSSLRSWSLSLGEVRAFATGTDVRLQWSVEGGGRAKGNDGQSIDDELLHIKGFKIEMQRNGSQTQNWAVADETAAHVRATTLHELAPLQMYKFRVRMELSDGASLVSRDSAWLHVHLPHGDTTPQPPRIDELWSPTPTSVKISWSDTASWPNARARHFLVHWSKIQEEDRIHSVRLSGNSTSYTLTSLDPDTDYRLNVVAENQKGRSHVQQHTNIRTRAMYPTGGGHSNSTAAGLLAMVEQKFGSLRHMEPQLLAFVCGVGAVLLLFVCILCAACCSMRSGRAKRKKEKSGSVSSGKFVDTARRIFHEQKVHRSRLYQPSSSIGSVLIGNMGATLGGGGQDGEPDERSPLQMAFENSTSTNQPHHAVIHNGSGGFGRSAHHHETLPLSHISSSTPQHHKTSTAASFHEGSAGGGAGGTLRLARTPSSSHNHARSSSGIISQSLRSNNFYACSPVHGGGHQQAGPTTSGISVAEEEVQAVLDAAAGTFVTRMPPIDSSFYTAAVTARCYSPDSGTSHELIMPVSSPTSALPPYSGMLLGGGGGSSGSAMVAAPISGASRRCGVLSGVDSVLGSPGGGTAASSLADTSSAGGILVAKSSTSSAGGVSRDCPSAHSSPSDGIQQPPPATRAALHTFKMSDSQQQQQQQSLLFSNGSSPARTTLDRRRQQNQQGGAHILQL